MGTDNSFYVKSIATYASTFFGYIISVLAIVIQVMLSIFSQNPKPNLILNPNPNLLNISFESSDFIEVLLSNFFFSEDPNPMVKASIPG